MKIEEEDLKLETDIAVAEAKTKILDKYEQSEKSENFATASNISSHNSEHEAESHNPIK